MFSRLPWFHLSVWISLLKVQRKVVGHVTTLIYSRKHIQGMVKSSQAVEKMLTTYSKCTVKFNSSCHKVTGEIKLCCLFKPGDGLEPLRAIPQAEPFWKLIIIILSFFAKTVLSLFCLPKKFRLKHLNQVIYHMKHKIRIWMIVFTSIKSNCDTL